MKSKAFSLVELLVVIALIAIMAAAGAVVIGDGSQSLNSASAAASSMFSLARTEAILRRVPTRVIVDTSFDSDSPDNFLRRIAVVVFNPDTNAWEQVSRWTVLPGRAFFNETASVGHGSASFPGVTGGPGPYEYFEFSPNGQASGRAQFVLSRGVVTNGSFQETGGDTRSGFFLHRMGKPTFFAEPSEIPRPW